MEAHKDDISSRLYAFKYDKCVIITHFRECSKAARERKDRKKERVKEASVA